MSLRSVNTKFWDDPFIEELTPSEKLLFLYLLTNPQANLLGIYELTIKRICYDTGLNKDTVLNGLKRFETVRKAFYTFNNFVILPNWLKNQNLNTNMKVAVEKEFKSLPNKLKIMIIGEPLGNGSERFETIRERLGNIIEYNINRIEVESELNSPSAKTEHDYSFVSDSYKTILEQWIKYKKSRNQMYKTQQTLEACYRNIIRLSGDNPLKAQLIIDQSIGNNYDGLFPLKEIKEVGKSQFEPQIDTSIIKEYEAKKDALKKQTHGN